MLQVTISGSMSELASLFAFLATRTDVEDTFEHHVTKPLFAAQPQPPQSGTAQPVFPAQQPHAEGGKRRGRRPATAATASILDQPTAAAGPFGNGAPAAQPQQPAAAAGPFGNAAPAPAAVIPEMIQTKASALIGEGKMGGVVATFQKYGGLGIKDIPVAQHAALYAELSTL